MKNKPFYYPIKCCWEFFQNPNKSRKVAVTGGLNILTCHCVWQQELKVFINFTKKQQNTSQTILVLQNSIFLKWKKYFFFILFGNKLEKLPPADSRIDERGNLTPLSQCPRVFIRHIFILSYSQEMVKFVFRAIKMAWMKE